MHLHCLRMMVMMVMMMVVVVVNIVNMKVETLVPAAAKGTHLLLVQMGGVVVVFCLETESQ